MHDTYFYLGAYMGFRAEVEKTITWSHVVSAIVETDALSSGRMYIIQRLVLVTWSAGARPVQRSMSTVSREIAVDFAAAKDVVRVVLYSAAISCSVDRVRGRSSVMGRRPGTPREPVVRPQ